MRTLKNEQQAFADAAKKIDPSKSAPEVFKQIQNEHPTPESLIPDVAKDLETIRQYLLDFPALSWAMAPISFFRMCPTSWITRERLQL